MYNIQFFFKSLLQTLSQADIQTHRRAFALRVYGNILLCQGQYDDSFEIHGQALYIQLKTWGESHFETGVLYHRMGCHYERTRCIEKAMYVVCMLVLN